LGGRFRGNPLAQSVNAAAEVLLRGGVPISAPRAGSCVAAVSNSRQSFADTPVTISIAARHAFYGSTVRWKTRNYSSCRRPSGPSQACQADSGTCPLHCGCGKQPEAGGSARSGVPWDYRPAPQRCEGIGHVRPQAREDTQGAAPANARGVDVWLSRWRRALASDHAEPHVDHAFAGS